MAHELSDFITLLRLFAQDKELFYYSCQRNVSLKVMRFANTTRSTHVDS